MAINKKWYSSELHIPLLFSRSLPCIANSFLVPLTTKLCITNIIRFLVLNPSFLLTQSQKIFPYLCCTQLFRTMHLHINYIYWAWIVISKSSYSKQAWTVFGEYQFGVGLFQRNKITRRGGKRNLIAFKLPPSPTYSVHQSVTVMNGNDITFVTVFLANLRCQHRSGEDVFTCCSLKLAILASHFSVAALIYLSTMNFK